MGAQTRNILFSRRRSTPGSGSAAAFSPPPRPAGLVVAPFSHFCAVSVALRSPLALRHSAWCGDAGSLPSPSGPARFPPLGAAFPSPPSWAASRSAPRRSGVALSSRGEMTSRSVPGRSGLRSPSVLGASRSVPWRSGSLPQRAVPRSPGARDGFSLTPSRGCDLAAVSRSAAARSGFAESSIPRRFRAERPSGKRFAVIPHSAGISR